MIDLDLGDAIQFNVKYNGQTYNLREPSVEEVDQFRRVDAVAEGANVVVEFLSQLGMPREILRTMSMSQSKKLVDGLMDALVKKK